MQLLLMKLLTLLVLSTVIYAQNRIIVDGNPDDWNDKTSLWTSDAVTSNGSVTLQELKAFNDDQFLFLYFKSEEVFSLQSFFTLKMYLDTDFDTNTGLQVESMGAEIEFTFSTHEGIAHINGNQIAIGFPSLFMITAPTVDSNFFEIAIERSSVINGTTVFSSDSIKILFKDETVSDGSKTDIVKYNFSGDSFDPLPQYSFEKKADNYLRVLSHNVEFDGFFENANKPAFERMYRVIDPNIIGFSEIYDHTPNQVAERLEEILPSTEGQSWSASKIADNLVATRYTIKGSWTLGGFGNGAFLVDMRPDYNTDALIVVAHPPCCTGNDAQRQREIDAIMAFVRDAKEPGGSLTLADQSPILIMGDMNFVGDPQQLKTLLTGDIYYENLYGNDFNPDWDNTQFEDAHPLVAELPMSFTQGNSHYIGTFSRGRLDYIIYSNSVMEMKNGFVLYTNKLPGDILSAYGLQHNDSESASDHFPVVADFKLTGLFKNLILIEPQSRSTYQPGENINITWESENLEFVNLSYRWIDNDTWIEIANYIDASEGEYNYLTAPNIDADSLIIRIEDSDNSSVFDESGPIYIVNPVNIHAVNIPHEFKLFQNYPNPFNPETTIIYALPQKEFVSLVVYDLLGEEVKAFVKKEMPAGKYIIKFDADDLSSGVYLYKFTAGDFSETKKMILIR